MSKAKLTILETVYPPISNQEAVWLESVAEVEARLRQSDFYMIAARTEAKFVDVSCDEDEQAVSFKFVVGDAFSDPVTIRLRDLPAFENLEPGSYWLEAGDKLIRVWDGPIGEDGSNVLEWFTTEKLIWDRSRGRPGIERFDRYREAAVYDLLYVGIATVGDSFDRLIARGHKTRMNILSNEPQRLPGARTTDEIYLFMFSVDPMIMTTFEPGHDFSATDLNGRYDAKRIVADAEKAFVSLLKPEYNKVTFTSYPQGADGLYGSGYDRYAYVIGESMTFNTACGAFRGGRDELTGFITNDCDCIFVEGDSVSFFRAGVDFPDASGAPPASAETGSGAPQP